MTTKSSMTVSTLAAAILVGVTHAAVAAGAIGEAPVQAAEATTLAGKIAAPGKRLPMPGSFMTAGNSSSNSSSNTSSNSSGNSSSNTSSNSSSNSSDDDDGDYRPRWRR